MKKDYCKDFIILLCVIGIIGCIVAITKLDSRLDNIEEYQYEQQGGHTMPEITGILDSEPQLVRVCSALKLASAKHTNCTK